MAAVADTFPRRTDEYRRTDHGANRRSDVRVADMRALQHLLLRRLGGQQGVRQTRTVMVLSTAKEDTYVDPAPEGDVR